MKQPATYDDLGGHPEKGTGPGAQERYEPTPPYRRPLERNVVVGPMLVSTLVCNKCGEVFAYGIPLRDGSKIDACLPNEASPEDPDCPRCSYSDKTCPDDAKQAMQECRWRYNQYKEARASLGGVSNAGIRDHFLKAHDIFWRYGPVLLLELERIYGDQLTRGVHEIETGGEG